MGLFAEILHMMPWDVDRLTYQQFEALAEYAQQRAKEGTPND